jgi:hypothetical protein
MSKVVKDKGLEVPGRPVSLQKGRNDAEVANWLLSGSGTAAYSAVGSTEELTNRVTPRGAEPIAGPTAGGMDATPKAPPAKGTAPGAVPMASPEDMTKLLEMIERNTRRDKDPVYPPAVMVPPPTVRTR